MRATNDGKKLDRLADQWAREHGVKLPSERDTGRLLGDSFVTSEQLKTLTERKDDVLEMRAYLELVEARLRALNHQQVVSADERRRLELHARILRMRFEGTGMDERAIARAFGRRSHSWASERLHEIEAAARAHGRPAGVVAVRCHRARCTRVVTRFTGTGRPPRYCSDECAHAERQGRYRARRRSPRCATVSRET